MTSTRVQDRLPQRIVFFPTNCPPQPFLRNVTSRIPVKLSRQTGLTREARAWFPPRSSRGEVSIGQLLLVLAGAAHSCPFLEGYPCPSGSSWPGRLAPPLEGKLQPSGLMGWSATSSLARVFLWLQCRPHPGSAPTSATAPCTSSKRPCPP